MLKIIENAVSIRLKKALNKESQEAGSFFCPPAQKVWSIHAGVFKAVPVSFFPCPACANGRFKLWGCCCCPKLFRDQVQDDEQKTQVRRFGMDVCTVQGMVASTACGPVCPQGSVGSAEKASNGVWLHAPHWGPPAGSDFVPEAKRYHSHQDRSFPVERSDTFPLTRLLPCAVFTPNPCSWRHFAWCLRFLKTAVKKKFHRKSQL